MPSERKPVKEALAEHLRRTRPMRKARRLMRTMKPAEAERVLREAMKESGSGAVHKARK